MFTLKNTKNEGIIIRAPCFWKKDINMAIEYVLIGVSEGKKSKQKDTQVEYKKISVKAYTEKNSFHIYIPQQG